MAAYRIVLGGIDAPIYTFEDSEIANNSINLSTAVDVVGTELSVDLLTATVDYYVGGDLLFSPADYNGVLSVDGYLFSTADILADITKTPYGTPITLTEDNTIVAKLYVQNIVRVGQTKYRINAMSAIGILEHQRHYGDLYNNVPIADFLTELIGAAFPYSVDPAVATETISGWLPLDNKRNNLHRMMQAMGVTLTKDGNGDIQFSFLYDGDAQNVPSNRIYINGTVDYNALASAVEVTEHSYIQVPASDQTEQLFDNSAQMAVSNLLVEFSEPHYDLTASVGLTIVDSGVNYAIVSGNGTLTGKKYTHNTRTITKQAVDPQGAENIAKCDNNTLINSLNSEAVANRLLAFYSSRKTVSASIINQGEKCGDKISFVNAFGEENSGFISAMESTPTTFIKSALKIITDYVPTGGGNFYHNRVAIDESGTWTVPSGVTRIRLVLIAGGGGGDGGYDGEHGRGNGFTNYGGDFTYIYQENEWGQCINIGYVYAQGNQAVSKGGKAGKTGNRGKVLIVESNVSEGDILSFTIGACGIGGASNGGLGTNGTETSVSGAITATTANGQTVNGYFDPFTGEVYALPGLDGIPGGDGGQTDTESLYAANGANGFRGGNAGSWTGGNPGGGTGLADPHDYNIAIPVGYYTFRASGGGGGGAAYGAKGGNADAGTWDISGFANYWYNYPKGGEGGNGANASQYPKPLYGCGGGGGNGGGGGGNAGAARTDKALSTIGSGWFYPHPQNGGTGGNGSYGGDGGDGVAIIYY